jgi:homoserine kinase type II
MGLDETIISAASLWNLDIKIIVKDKEIAGSPERCEFRFVVQDRDDRLYVIESLLHEEVSHKRNIINTLNFLSERGVKEIQPYLSNTKGESILHHEDRFWQVIPYVDGITLDRPNYVFDKWRGKVVAEFLIQLRDRSNGVPNFSPTNSFSIKKYIYMLLDRIKEYESALFMEIQPLVEFLEKSFMGIHDTLPTAFCHGDFHSLNIIWSPSGINAVIDWEFLGYKPELYDAANMIGCIGVEAPESLIHDFVGDFIFYLKHAGVMSPVSWEYLLEFVIALRFAWLSEWLRHNDREMIKLETTYMNLLMNNSGDIRNAWTV